MYFWGSNRPTGVVHGTPSFNPTTDPLLFSVLAFHVNELIISHSTSSGILESHILSLRPSEFLQITSVPNAWIYLKFGV